MKASVVLGVRMTQAQVDEVLRRKPKTVSQGTYLRTLLLQGGEPPERGARCLTALRLGDLNEAMRLAFEPEADLPAAPPSPAPPPASEPEAEAPPPASPSRRLDERKPMFEEYDAARRAGKASSYVREPPPEEDDEPGDGDDWPDD